MLRYLSKTSWAPPAGKPGHRQRQVTGNARYDNALDPPWNGDSEVEAEPFGKEEMSAAIEN